MKADEILYKNHIIAKNEYPHPTLKYQYWHEYDTDGMVHHCETIVQCMDEIDDWCDEFNPKINEL